MMTRKKLFPDDIFNVADIALAVRRADPDRTAVIAPAGRNADGSRRYDRYSYAELSRDVESIAVGLRERGIGERTRTVFMAPPSYDGCVVGLALTRVGATTVWIDPAVGYRNVAERLKRLDVEAFVGIPIAHLGRLAFGWGRRFGMKSVVIGSLAAFRRPVPTTPTAPAVRPVDPAAIMYTTGSTGPAKPALYTHAQLCNIFRYAHRTWRFDDSRVPIDMPVFPAFFSIGLAAGGTIVIPPIDYVRQGPAKVDARALLEVINDCKVQTLFASPVILEKLAAEGTPAPSLQTVIGGGAPLYANVIGPLREMLGAGGEVNADYGSTEALPATEMPGAEALAETYAATARGEGLCVGTPFDGVTLKIIDITEGAVSRLRELPRGEIGEIVVRGPHVSTSYANDPASTAQNKITQADGVWHRLGDAGYLDAEGRLWVCGRVGHRIELANGNRMYPLMCEPIFDAHPAVRRSALVGVRGTPVICIEVAHKDHDPAVLRAELLALAAAHPTTNQIRHLLFHRRLPVDPRHNSKIERPALARWAANRIDETRPHASLSSIPSRSPDLVHGRAR
jgi:acyl-CoA synthetase (AMP-forming)/AMP-acid ligase II